MQCKGCKYALMKNIAANMILLYKIKYFYIKLYRFGSTILFELRKIKLFSKSRLTWFRTHEVIS